MRLHFTGIGGIGISALAQFCLARGDSVTGSELQETVILPKLRELGIKVTLPQKEENVETGTELLVYSEAVPESNPERVWATKNNIPQKSYFAYLGEISKDYRTIAVCGTHGKTSTIALLASGFAGTDFDPTVVVGTTLPQFGETNFHKGNNDWMLIEACEYRRNFRFLKPEIVILADLDYDHPDAFPTEADYYQAFTDFCENAETVIYHDNEKSRRVLASFKGHRVPVSNPGSGNLEPGLKPLYYNIISGEYNRRNLALALETANYLEVDMDKFKKGLEKFVPPGRRQEYLGEKDGLHIYDDYAHHPTELKALISALKEKHPQSKIAMIFEPHQHARTIQFFDGFVEVLQLPDHIGIFPIYPARDTKEDKQKMPTSKLIEAIPDAVEIKNVTDAREFYAQLNKGDVLVFTGAGKIDELAKHFMGN